MTNGNDPAPECDCVAQGWPELGHSDTCAAQEELK